MSVSEDPQLTQNVNLLTQEVLDFVISSNIDTINDILLNLLIINIATRNQLINEQDFDPLILNSEPLTALVEKYDLVDNYHKFVLTDECILDQNQELKITPNNTHPLKKPCLVQLKDRLSLLGFEFQIVKTMNSEEYNLVYSNIANQFPMLTDVEITQKIKSWGNLKKSYHFFKSNKPGNTLRIKLTTQSEFNKNEIFFIKSIVDILQKSKESLVYSLEDVNLTKVDNLNSKDDIFLIGLYKLYYNMELISRDTTYEKFVDTLKSENLKLGLLKRFDYMIDEIQAAYDRAYDFYRENEMPTSDPNEKTYVEEIQRLNQNEIKKILDYMIQQKWAILYPNSSVKASLKLHHEMNTPLENKCFKCPNSISIEQGIQCASCGEGFVCLSCSKTYFNVSKETLNKKDKSVTDGKWCPKCFEPWKTPNDMVFYL